MQLEHQGLLDNTWRKEVDQTIEKISPESRRAHCRESKNDGAGGDGHHSEEGVLRASQSEKIAKIVAVHLGATAHMCLSTALTGVADS